MADKELGVGITATTNNVDTAAAQLKTLNASLKALQDAQAQYATKSTEFARAFVASTQKEIDVINTKIAAITASTATVVDSAVAQTVAIERVTAAQEKQNLSMLGGASAASILTRESRHAVAIMDSLARGQRGQVISSIGAAMRDAGTGTSVLLTGIGGLVAAMALLGLEKKTQELGEWAAESQAAAVATGMTVNQLTRLTGGLTLMGVEGNEAITSLRQFARNLETAYDQPSSKAAQSLRQLGFTQTEIAEGTKDVYGTFMRVSDALHAYSDGADRAEILNNLMGRSSLKLSIAVANGSAALQQAGNRAEELGHTLNDTTAPALQKAGENVTDLSQTISGRATIAFETWLPEINAVTEALKFLAGAGLGAIDTVGKIAAGAYDAVKAYTDLALAAAGVPGTQYDKRNQPTYGKIPGPQVPIAGQAPQAQQGQVANYPPMPTEAQFKGIYENETQIARANMELQVSLAKGSTEKIRTAYEVLINRLKDIWGQYDVHVITAEAEMNRAIEGSSKKAATQSYEEFAASEKEKIAEADKDINQIDAIYTQWLARAKAQYTQDSKQYQEVLTQKIRADQEAVNKILQQEKQASKEAFDAQKDYLTEQQALTSLGRVSRGDSPDSGGQYIATEISIRAEAQRDLNNALAEQTQLLDAQSNGYAITDTEIDNAEKKVTQFANAVRTSTSNIDNALKQANAGFTNFFSKVGEQTSSFENELMKAFLSPGTKTIMQTNADGIRVPVTVSLKDQELRSAWQKLVLGFGQDLFQAVQDALLKAFAQKLLAPLLGVGGQIGGSAGVSDVLGAGIGKLLGSNSAGGNNTAGGLTPQLAAQFQQLTGSLKQGQSALLIFQTATQASSVATTTDTATTSAGTVATASNTVATTAGTASTVVNATTTDVNTASTASNTVASDANSTSLLKSAADAAIAGIEFLIAGIKALAFEGGGVVPSAAGGMVVGGLGGGGILSILHPQEMVLPAKLSNGIQGIINSGGTGGGGSNLNLGGIHIQAIDTQNGMSFLMNNASNLWRMLVQQARLNGQNTGLSI